MGINVLPLSAYQRIHPAFAEDVVCVFDVHASIDRRQAKGGTALKAVVCQLEEAKTILKYAAD